MARVTVGLAAIATLGCFVWAAVEFGGAREHNIAYQDAQRSDGGGSADPGVSLDDLAAGRQPADTPTASPRNDIVEQGPDALFAIPATVAALLTTLTLSIRATLAEDWRERREQLDDVLDFAEEREAELEEGRAVRTQADAAVAAIDTRLATAAHDEIEFTRGLFGRFREVTQQSCAARGVSTPQLTFPPLPEPFELLGPMLYQRGPGGSNGRSDPPPDDPPPNGSSPPPDDPPPPNGSSPPPNGGAPGASDTPDEEPIWGDVRGPRGPERESGGQPPAWDMPSEDDHET